MQRYKYYPTQAPGKQRTAPKIKVQLSALYVMQIKTFPGRKDAYVMRMLRDRWMPMFAVAKAMERQLGRKMEESRDIHELSMNADYRAAEALMSISETIVFPSNIMLDLIHNLDRIDTRGTLRLPYPYVLVQFTNPIPEADIMKHVEENELQQKFGFLNDTVQGILIANADQDKAPFPPHHIFNMLNCCILFESTSVNRVVWQGTDKPAEPKWDKFFADKEHITPESLDNKYRMIHLCYAISLFLNSPNVIVERQKPDPKVQAKREKKGKQQLPEYHIVTIQKVQTVYTEPSGRKGSEHSRMYPVRAHFRRIKGFPEPIWIPNHYRGLKHGAESMLKEVYKVAPKK